MLLSDELIYVGDLFVDKLWRVGEIMSPEFSFAMYGIGLNSYIDFGKPNESRVCDENCNQAPKEVVFGFNDDFYWSTALQGIASGNTEYNGFALDSPTQSYSYAIFDTGSPHLTLPDYIYDKVLNKLIEVSGEQVFYTKDGITFVDCFQVGQMLPIYLMVNQHWLQVDPYDYVWDVENDGSTCILMMVQHKYDFFILGQPIFQGYYTHHNLDYVTIGFTPLVGSGKDLP